MPPQSIGVVRDEPRIETDEVSELSKKLLRLRESLVKVALKLADLEMAQENIRGPNIRGAVARDRASASILFALGGTGQAVNALLAGASTHVIWLIRLQT
jgi:hypothetical protein